MSSELMTTAVCWEVGANVSAEYGKDNSTFYYFCPERNCLEKVVPAQRNNKFFKAPNRHVTGCKNEKESSENSNVQGEQKKVAMAVPPPIIPSHLGAIPTTKKIRQCLREHKCLRLPNKFRTLQQSTQARYRKLSMLGEF